MNIENPALATVASLLDKHFLIIKQKIIQQIICAILTGKTPTNNCKPQQILVLDQQNQQNADSVYRELDALINKSSPNIDDTLKHNIMSIIIGKTTDTIITGNRSRFRV